MAERPPISISRATWATGTATPPRSRSRRRRRQGLLAVRGIDRGAAAYLDVEVVADIPDGSGTRTVTVVPYLDGGYRYKVVPNGSEPGFAERDYDDSSFADGAAAFGSPYPCAIYDNVSSPWPPNSDVLVRRLLRLPSGATNVRVKVAIDNDVQVFLDGVDISGGRQFHEGCATNDSFVFAVPDALLLQPDPGLPDGSEGSGIDGESLSAPTTFDTSGTHVAEGTVADHAGNRSESATYTARIDADAPTVRIQGCPGVVYAGDDVSVEILANDGESGLEVDPGGSRALDTTGVGPRVVEALARDRVGHETTATCEYRVNTVPSTPGAPVADVSADADGVFHLAWDAAGDADGDPLTYTLLHRPANDGATVVRRGVSDNEHAFEPGSAEAEGTFTYRVIASDGERSSAPSDESDPVKTDKTPPHPPTALIPPPDWVDPADATSRWHRDAVTVGFAAAGDPDLADASAGVGVDPDSVTREQTFATSGPHTARGTVLDLVGNRSAATTPIVHVDADPPTVSVSCRSVVRRGESATALVTAADRESGLAADPSGVTRLDTSTAGEHTFMASARDHVDHRATASCGYRVEDQPQPPPPPPAPPSPVVTCEGLEATIVATTGQTVLRGTAGPDVIVGTDAAERIEGRGGDDTICSGRGKDVISGGPGDDRLRGGAGEDRLAGGAGRDLVLGGAGDDRLSGDAGDDRLGGGTGEDRVDGGTGNDTLDEFKLGGYGKDLLFGGRGDDRVVTAGETIDRVDCGPGTDSLTMDRFDRQRRCERVRRLAPRP